MKTEAAPNELVGRGAEEGARLFREWYAGLSRVSANGGQAAYVFVMGSLAELLRVFDLPMVFPEINSLQTAVRRSSHELLARAEDYGYSPDICGYVKADVATQLSRGEHPMGRIPKPSLVVLTNACNTYIKWAEIWDRLHGVPIFTLDVPGNRACGRASRRGEASYETDLRYVAAQVGELIRLCEKVTGKRFDLDRLRGILAEVNDMTRSYRKVLALNRARPAPYNALMDGTVYLGVSNALRGTPEGSLYFRQLVEELEFKVANGLAPLSKEEFRLAAVGVPCYPIYRRFNEMFSQWGGTFVVSSYMRFASGGVNVEFEYDLDRPLESLAEGILLTVRDAMDSMFYPERILAQAVGPYGIDGALFHPVKSCRTTSTGMADARRVFMEETGLPSLILESDMMDKRVVSEAQMKNRIDAFFEALRSQRMQRLAARQEG